MLCNELTSKEATYGKINLLYINPYFVQPTHLTNCFIEAALFASYTSFHNKERSSEVEIVLFFHTSATLQREKEVICGVWNCLSKVVLLI